MSDSNSHPQSLKLHQRTLLAVFALLLRMWGRTLRFHFKEDVKAVLEGGSPPSVVIFWHNRLFAAPIFYHRYFRNRRLASLISASSDGAWLAGFVKKLGMRPVRGSRYQRGTQAVRDLIHALRDGYDVAVSPDGSRGPVYDMKAGAVTVALKTGAPILLVSFNHSGAWRLKTWDRFFIPHPFSRVQVSIDTVEQDTFLSEDPKEAAAMLKLRMDAITED